MNLLKSKTVWFAILIAVLPVTPVQQMLVGGASPAAHHHATYLGEIT